MGFLFLFIVGGVWEVCRSGGFGVFFLLLFLFWRVFLWFDCLFGILGSFFLFCFINNVLSGYLINNICHFQTSVYLNQLLYVTQPHFSKQERLQTSKLV